MINYAIHDLNENLLTMSLHHLTENNLKWLCGQWG